MGIIEGRKLLNHKGTDNRVHKLVQEYVDMQEDAVEKTQNLLIKRCFGVFLGTEEKNTLNFRNVP